MIKACLFDLDGVIVDTAKYHKKAWKNLADDLGIDFTDEDNERLKGVGRMESLNILLEMGDMMNVSIDQQRQMADRKNSDYLSYLDTMATEELLPGVMDFLKELRHNGIKIGIGSASKNAMTILSKVGIKTMFDVIIDGNKISKGKPDPEVFLLGAKELGISPADCVVFEDAQVGIESAVNAGMRCVGVGEPSVLHKADFVIPSLKHFTLEMLREKLHEPVVHA